MGRLNSKRKLSFIICPHLWAQSQQCCVMAGLPWRDMGCQPHSHGNFDAKEVGHLLGAVHFSSPGYQ